MSNQTPSTSAHGGNTEFDDDGFGAPDNSIPPTQMDGDDIPTIGNGPTQRVHIRGQEAA